jgi:hypothetical protein
MVTEPPLIRPGTSNTSATTEMKQPVPTTSAAKLGLNDKLTALEGIAIRGIRYLVPPPILDGSRFGASSFDEVDSVEITFVSGSRLVVRWAMDAALEGLAIEIVTKDSATDGLVAADVTATPAWRDLVGNSIMAWRTAWQVSNADCPETLWSIAAVCFSGAAVAFALGEERGLGLSYMPDSMVVIFSEPLAVGYTIAASQESAWGSPI